MPTPSTSTTRCSCCRCRATIGIHPETGKPITAGLGRYGPFILHDGTYANLPSVEEVFSVGINRAVVLLAEKKAGGGKGRFQRAAPTVLKELGEHPSEGGKVQVLSGRYGPYVKHGDVNATLPRGKEPAALTMDEAVQLIAERAAKGPSKPKGDAASRRQGQGATQAAKSRAKRQGQAAAKPKSQGQGRRARQPAREKLRSRSGHATVARKPKRSPPRRGLPSKDEILDFMQNARVKAGQARDRARLLGQGRRPRRAQAAAHRDGRGGPARRQPQGLQGARASCRPWPCSRSSPAMPTAS